MSTRYDAGDGGESEAVRGEVPVLALSKSLRDHGKVEQPLDTILVACFPNALLNRHIVSGEMVWVKDRQ